MPELRPIQPDGAAVGLDRAGQQAAERALAGSRRPHHDQALAGLEPEGDIAQEGAAVGGAHGSGLDRELAPGA